MTIYRLNTAGKTTTANGSSVIEDLTDADAKSAAEAAAARVSIADTSVTVQLSNAWRSGGELVVVLRNVETAVPSSLSSTTGTEAETSNLPYHNYPIVVSSRKSGRLDALDPVLINHDASDATNPTDRVYSRQPAVRVGNIFGNHGVEDHDETPGRDGDQHYGADRIAREFTITPATVYEGETDKTFKVTFTAKGPMYTVGDAQASIVVTIPDELQSDAGLTADNVSVIARGRVQPSGNLDVGVTPRMLMRGCD